MHSLQEMENNLYFSLGFYFFVNLENQDDDFFGHMPRFKNMLYDLFLIKYDIHDKYLLTYP